MLDDDAPNYETPDFLAAFTVAELGELLPMHHNYGAPESGKCNRGDEYSTHMIHWYNLWHDRTEYDRYQLKDIFVAATEADARAKMLIYLLENNLMALPACSSAQAAASHS